MELYVSLICINNYTCNIDKSLLLSLHLSELINIAICTLKWTENESGGIQYNFFHLEGFNVAVGLSTY